MRKKTPPRLAVLLLELFVGNEPLAGDLEEEYRAGRSRAWYWRQVAAAVGAGPLRDFDVHDLFAVQRMPMQVIMLGLVSVCAVFTVKLIGVWAIEHDAASLLVSPAGLRELLRLAVSVAVAIPIGIVIARIHAASRGVAVLALSVIVPLWAAANLFVLNGAQNLDAVLPHVLASLVFIAGLLSGGIYVEPLTHGRTMPR